MTLNPTGMRRFRKSRSHRDGMEFDLYLLHGRLDPTSGGTDAAGHLVDDWGFAGPRLKHCIGVHGTYGELHIFFKDVGAATDAKAATGWENWDDTSLVLPMKEDCVVMFNAARNRKEYFGDWGLKLAP